MNVNQPQQQQKERELLTIVVDECETRKQFFNRFQLSNAGVSRSHIGPKYNDRNDPGGYYMITGRLLSGCLNEGETVAFMPRHSAVTPCTGAASFYTDAYGMSVVKKLQEAALSGKQGTKLIFFVQPLLMDDANNAPQRGDTIVLESQVDAYRAEKVPATSSCSSGASSKKTP